MINLIVVDINNNEFVYLVKPKELHGFISSYNYGGEICGIKSRGGSDEYFCLPANKILRFEFNSWSSYSSNVYTITKIMGITEILNQLYNGGDYEGEI